MSNQGKATSQRTLPRTLGLLVATLVTAAMIIGTGIFAALGSATAVAGSGILLAMAISGLITLLTGISAAQLGINYPNDGGAFIWAREVKHETLGFIAGCSYLGKGITSLGVISLVFAQYSAQIIPGLSIPLTATALVLVIVSINSFGTGPAVKALIALMIVNVSLLSIFVLFALPAASPANLANPLGSNGIVGILSGAAIFFWSWDGFMRTAIMAGEVKNPRGTLPYAIIGGIGIAAAIFLAVGATAVGVLGPASTGKDDIPLFRAAGQAIPVWGTLLVLVAVWFTAFTEPVGDMLAASRVAFAMGDARELPRWLGEIHPQYHVPRNAVLFLGLAVIVLVQFFDLRQVLAVANVFTIGWYSITHFSALKLRKEQRLTTPIISVVGLGACLGLLVFLPPWGSLTGGAILAALAVVRWALTRRKSPLLDQRAPSL